MSLLDTEFSDGEASGSVEQFRKVIGQHGTCVTLSEQLRHLPPELASLLWGLDRRDRSWIGALRYWRHQFLQASVRQDAVASPEQLVPALDGIKEALSFSYHLTNVENRIIWVDSVLGGRRELAEEGFGDSWIDGLSAAWSDPQHGINPNNSILDVG